MSMNAFNNPNLSLFAEEAEVELPNELWKGCCALGLGMNWQQQFLLEPHSSVKACIDQSWVCFLESIRVAATQSFSFMMSKMSIKIN